MSDPTSEAMSRAGKGTGGESEVGRSRPLPCGDAITWGVPVVCSDGSLPADVVREYRLGTLFRAGDADSLCASRAARVPAAIHPDDLARAALPSLVEPRWSVAEQALHALGVFAASAAVRARRPLVRGRGSRGTVSSAVCADVSSQSPSSLGVCG